MNSLLNTFSWISQIRFSNTAHINVLQLLPFSRIRDFQGIPVDFLYFGPEIYSSFQVLKQNSCIYNIYSTEDSRAPVKQLQGSTGLTWWFCSIQTHGNWKKKANPQSCPSPQMSHPPWGKSQDLYTPSQCSPAFLPEEAKLIFPRHPPQHCFCVPADPCKHATVGSDPLSSLSKPNKSQQQPTSHQQFSTGDMRDLPFQSSFHCKRAHFGNPIPSSRGDLNDGYGAKLKSLRLLEGPIGWLEPFCTVLGRLVGAMHSTHCLHTLLLGFLTCSLVCKVAVLTGAQITASSHQLISANSPK